MPVLKEVTISPTCRANSGSLGAIDKALAELKAKYVAELAAMDEQSEPTFVVSLKVEHQ